MRRYRQPKVTRPDEQQASATRFNRKFNSRRKSLERWHSILDRLNDFEGVITSYDGATPNEVKTLKAIHSKLYECKSLAEKNLKEAMNLEVLRQGI